MRKSGILAVGMALAAWVAPAPASARLAHKTSYTFAQSFGSALRLIKVDLGFKVTEVNSEWGYFLFEYTSTESGKRKNHASFEFVKRDDFVLVSLQVPEMPNYHEQLIVEKLKRKLVQEHGDAPAQRRKDDDNDSDDSDDDKDGKKPAKDDDKKKGDKAKKRKPRRGRRKRSGRS